jgi:DNA-damage-inducible protein D
MNSTELAVNWFCTTQVEEKLKRDEVSGKQTTEQTHFEVTQKVRQAIVELGGRMPESGNYPENPDNSHIRCAVNRC